MFKFSDIGGRISASVGHVEEFGWFYDCEDVVISNQACDGGGACVANGVRHGAIEYFMLDLWFCERLSVAYAFLIGVFFSSTCISGSDPGTTAPGSSVFFNMVSSSLKEDSIFWSIGCVIEIVGGYGGL